MGRVQRHRTATAQVTAVAATVLASTLVAALLAGCGTPGFAVADRSEAPSSPGPRSSSTHAAASDVQRAIDATIRGLDPGVIRKAAIGVVAGEATTQLNITVSTPSDQQGQALIPEWEAALLAGAAAGRLVAPGQKINQIIGAYQFQAATPDGNTVDEQGAALPPNTAGSHFPAAGLSDQQILDKVRSTVGKQGWTFVSGRVLHPLDPAVVVTVRMPAEAMDYSEQFRLLNNAIRTLDYTYSADPDQCAMAGDAIEVQDSTGERVLVSTQSCRAQAGSVWDPPDGPIGVAHGGPPPGT